MAASTYSAHSPEKYIETRVDFKTEVYRKKGDRYRWGYLITASAAAVAAATVPVLINLNGVPPIVPTLLSLLVTILVSLEGVFHLREHWKNYDLIKSFLRQESCLFQARAGAYRNKTPHEAFVLLVERVEDGIAKERSQTIEMRTSRAPDEQHRPNGGQGNPPQPPANEPPPGQDQ
jgi:hypothetical protein